MLRSSVEFVHATSRNLVAVLPGKESNDCPRGEALRRLVVGLLVMVSFTAMPSKPVNAWVPGDAPIATLTTGLVGPYHIAFDASGNMYVANFMNDTVTKYASGWNNGASPVATLSNGLSDPIDIAFDSSGRMYVANFFNGTVTKYATGWTNGAQPEATLTVANFGAHAVAFDSQDNMYVAETSGDTVKKYAAGWTAGAQPLETLTTGLQDPVDITFDSTGRMYVANLANNTVKRFASGWTTGAQPLASITVAGPTSISFDSDGNLHVVSVLTDTIEKFTSGWADGAQSVASLSIPNSTLMGVAFDSSNQMYVSDYTSDAVKRFAATPAPSPSFDVPIHRVTFDPNGGTCLDAVPHTEVWDSWFVLYRYIPAASDCTRTGHTFAGWARSTTPTIAAALPLLTDPSDGAFRYFIAEDADLIAIWTKDLEPDPEPQPPTSEPEGPVTLPVTGSDSSGVLMLSALFVAIGFVLVTRRRLTVD